MGGTGFVVGLNYQSVEFLFKIYKVKDRVKMLESIQEIELGAIEAMNRKAEESK